MTKPAPLSKPTLRKLGADLRWMIEKAGIDPEGLMVTIAVRDEPEKSRLVETLQREFDSDCMKRLAGTNNIICALGVNIAVVSEVQIAKVASRLRRDQEPA